MIKQSNVLALITTLIGSIPVYGEALPVIPDGDFNEWTSSAIAHADPIGDSASGNVDFGVVYIANDADQLFVRFETGLELKLQENNDLALYIDSDNNAGTGFDVGTIGAELAWRFGDRSGTVFSSSGGVAGTIRWDDLNYRQEPTVSNDEFEIAFQRSTVLFGQSLLDNSSLTLLFRDEQGGGDIAPDIGAIAYNFVDTPVPLVAPISLDREDESHLRVLSHNVLSDGWFETSRAQAFDRLYAAIAPDIFCFQEFWNSSAQAVESKVESLLAGNWHSARNDDNVIISKYPITKVHAIGGNLGVLIDLPDSEFPRDIYVIGAHLPCCGNDAGRAMEVDEILAWIRGLQSPESATNLEPNTPIIVTGDMNFVGYRQQLDSMLTGDIQDEVSFGADHPPDWDGTHNTDLFPRHAGERERFTWRNENSNFMPGRLDFLFYSDSVLKGAKTFLLWTPGLDTTTLNAAGLLANDTPTASDHIPLIADFNLNVSISPSVYVDFNAVPGGDGSAGAPFDSLTAALIAVVEPGEILISPGHSEETATIGQEVRISNVNPTGGVVQVGSTPGSFNREPAKSGFVTGAGLSR